jgi:hypothetical protein
MADQEIVGKLDANLLDASIFMPGVEILLQGAIVIALLQKVIFMDEEHRFHKVMQNYGA